MDIVDRAGAPTKEYMRKYFEAMVTQTESLRKSTPLDISKSNGKFKHYADPDSDTMWLGFALGMRCAARINTAGAPQCQ